MKRPILTILTIAFGVLSSSAETAPPNIVYILADDMGYGDVQILNPERGKIATPNMDQVAKDGLTFTDAHTTSSVCTPTRYGIMTGRYNWRTKLQKSVLDGYGLPLIASDRMTVPSFLNENGYTTAMIGKWHLGLDIATLDGKQAHPGEGLKEKKGKGAFPPEELSNIDWKKPIQGGPVDRGFDSWFGITASLDFPPYVWIRDRNWIGEGNYAKAFNRPGPATEDFEAIKVVDRLAEECVQYITDYESEKPFFIYIPLPSPHTPIVPSEKWQGKSGIGKYGDYMMQTDDLVGQVVKALDAKGLTENTLLIVTSDNGCSKSADFKNLESHGHFASAEFRGSKADLWDGGHRVPFLVKWPQVIKAGSYSDVLTCQTDLLATCAELLGKELPASAGEDSESILPILKGESVKFSRKGLIHHSVSGYFSYRQGKWKLLLSKGSGGWSRPSEKDMNKIPGSPEGQLYNMEIDPGEQNNLYLEKSKVVARLLAQLEKDVANGRSTAGPNQENDIPLAEIKLWKGRKSK